MGTKYNVTEQRNNQRPLLLEEPQRASQADRTPGYLVEISRQLQTRTFNPHPKLISGHAQTLASYYWPRGFLKLKHRQDEARLFEVEPGVRLLAHCRWQKDKPSHPTIFLVHGLEGANTSVYMLGTAEKAFSSGFNVVRLNLR